MEHRDRDTVTTVSESVSSQSTNLLDIEVSKNAIYERDVNDDPDLGNTLELGFWNLSYYTGTQGAHWNTGNTLDHTRTQGAHWNTGNTLDHREHTEHTGSHQNTGQGAHWNTGNTLEHREHTGTQGAAHAQRGVK